MNIYSADILLEALGISDLGVKWSGAFKTTLCIISIGTFYITAIFDLMNSMDDFSLFAENFSMLLIGFTGFVKYYTLIYSREKVKNLREVTKCHGISGQKLQGNHHLIIDDYDQVGLKFCKTYGWILYAVSLGLTMQTLPGMLLGHERQLPFAAAYPFNLNSTATFTIAYVHQTISTYIFIVIYLSFDSRFILLIHHACGHFCLLQDLLENIAEPDDEPSHTHDRIVRCVRLHQNIYKFVDEIEDLFNVSNLMQFLVSSVAICTSGYEAVTMGFEKPQVLVKHLSSVYGQIVQLLIFNWCGQLVEEKSLGVSHAIFKSNFYKLEVGHQRDLGLMLLRAQKPAYITAGKFSNLSLQNFSNLMKTSMSYFTMLRSVQEK